MAKTALLCIAAALSLALAHAAGARGDGASGLFTAHPASSSGALLTLATDGVDADRAWIQYEELVMSRARKNPLMLYFDGVSDASCDTSAGVINSDDDDDDVEEDDDAVFESRESEAGEKALACAAAVAQQNEQLQTALEAVARAHKASGLQVVRVPEELLSQMLHYHRVTTRPSLLWLPPRSAKGFQRFPHPETNALDLSAPEKLVEVLVSANANSRSSPSAATFEATNPSLTPEQQLPAVISEFVRQWFVKGGLAPKGGVSRAASGTQTEQSEDLSVADFVPALGLLAFLGFVVYDNRELLLRTLQGRFVWFMWSLGVLFVAYSGMFHSVIHGMSMFYFSPHYGFVLFHPSARRQFVLEGLLSGSWSFFVSLGAFSIVEILPMERSRLARNEIFWYSLFIAGIAYTILYMTFVNKNKWITA